ncbi:MAG TPA: hypothetical protein VH413_02620 [Verrucomicrobiae bacterium]|jgi:hypothetical protein|nr:hypothetical protein [Verrucomicrobiae bacterium]
MEDFVNPVGLLNSMNGALVLGIAGGIGAVFVLVVVIDAILRKRADRKKPGRGTHHRSAERGFFKSISLFSQQFKKEMGRRRRHRERARDRER